MISSVSVTKSFKQVQAFFEKPLIAYLSLIVLQFKVIWAMWDYKDLTIGDTSGYFSSAYAWFENFSVNIVWSPLYTAFYGSLLHVTNNVYAVTILHRLIIVFATTIMVLALLRKLLPHSIAWIISAWWAILPINFNTLVEVHLFSLLPLLAACLIILRTSATWTRGAAIAILFSSSVLVRNELSLLTFASIFICVVWEIWQFKISNKILTKKVIKRYLLSYGIPIILAIVIVIFFYQRSIIKFGDPSFDANASLKHTLNVCQGYAFGYKQRYSDWTGNHWTECQTLMERQFGQPMLSLFQAFWANPSAMIEHFLWNFSISLNGIQVSLFNATSGMINPDYLPVNLGTNWVIFPTIVVGIVCITGGLILYFDRHYWWEFWLKDRILAWSLLLIASLVCFFVIIPTQRPRPSYLFPLSLFLMTFTGMSIFIIFHRLKQANKLSVILPFFVIVSIWLSPNYYLIHSLERKLFNYYQTLLPFQSLMANNETVFLSKEYSKTLCDYLRKSESCQPLVYRDDFIQNRNMNDDGSFSKFSLSSEDSLEMILNKMGANLFFVDSNLINKFKNYNYTDSKKFLEQPEFFGWEIIAYQKNSDFFDNWMLLKKIEKKSD